MKLENELVKNHFSILISAAAAATVVVVGGSRAVCIAIVATNAASTIPFLISTIFFRSFSLYSKQQIESYIVETLLPLLYVFFFEYSLSPPLKTHSFDSGHCWLGSLFILLLLFFEFFFFLKKMCIYFSPLLGHFI